MFDDGYGVSCNGATDGEIIIEPFGGVGDYEYVLSIINENNVTQLVSQGLIDDLPSGSLQNLGAGEYILSVFDSNYNYFLLDVDYFNESDYESCVFEIPIIITEPYTVEISEPVFSDYNGFNTSCYGASDGSIDINAYGGEGLGLSVNYTYEWTGFNSDGNIDLGGQSNMSDISNLPAGSYQLVVYDSRLCSYEANFEIESLLQLNLNYYSLQMILLCVLIFHVLEKMMDGYRLIQLIRRQMKI